MIRFRIIGLLLSLTFISASIANAHESPRPEIYSFTQEYKNTKGEPVVQTNTIYFVTDETLSEALEFAESDLKSEGFSSAQEPDRKSVV